MASLLRKVGSSSLGFVAGRALAGLAGVLLLRALGPEQSGIYGAALGFAALFAVGATLGLDSALAGAVSRAPQEAGRRWSAGLVHVLLQALGIALLLALFLRLGGGAKVPPALILVAFAIMIINALGQVSAGAMQGLGLFGRQAVLGSMASALSAGGLLALLLAGVASAGTALGMALVTASLGALVWWWGRPEGLHWQRPRRAELGQSWRLGLPFALLTIGNLLFLKVDQALLAHLVAPVALGCYVAAVRLVDLLVPLLVALFNPLHPHLAPLYARAAQGEEDAAAAARWALDRAMRYMGALCWPLGVGGSLLAGELVRALYGPAFDGAAPALALLVWVAALSGPLGTLLQAAHGLGRTGQLAKLYFFSFVVNVALNLWLIPRFGIQASALLSVLGELINLAVVWAWCRRAGLGLAWRAMLWPSLPAALIMGLLLALVGRPAVAGLNAPLAAAVLVASGAALYAGALALLGFIGPDERRLLGRLLGRPA